MRDGASDIFKEEKCIFSVLPSKVPMIRVVGIKMEKSMSVIMIRKDK